MSQEQKNAMKIKNLTAAEVRGMTDSEGLVLQGCGGALNEWVDGINEMLTDENILINGARFTDVSAFGHNGVSNLLFNMDGVDLDMGKLAMWRLQSRETFGGTWLSDYLPNQMGVSAQTQQTQETTKPDSPIIGADGNIFSIMGIAGRTLKSCGMREQAAEMTKRVTASGSYDEALGVIMEYVNPVGIDEQNMDMQMGGL
jgi:hypothetical protein